MNIKQTSPPSCVAYPDVALRFHEFSDVVTIPCDKAESFSQLSICLWIKPMKLPKNHDPCYLIAKKGSFAVGLRGPEVAVAFHNKQPGWQWVGSKWKAPSKQWTHLSVTCDSLYERSHIYANGQLVFTQNVRGKLKASVQPLLVGVELKPENGTRTRFNGLIAQITLWKKVIAVDTINLHMSGGISGMERGIIGHWVMQEGVGNVIIDHSSCKRNGEIKGPLWWLSGESVGQVEVPPSSLMLDMKKMFNCPLGSDVTLEACDNGSLYAHKIILATRSEVFSSLFSAITSTLSAGKHTAQGRNFFGKLKAGRST